MKEQLAAFDPNVRCIEQFGKMLLSSLDSVLLSKSLVVTWEEQLKVT